MRIVFIITLSAITVHALPAPLPPEKRNDNGM